MNFFIKRDIGKLLPIPQTFLLLWLLVGLLQPASAQNNALHFDGNNDYLQVPHNSSLNFPTAMTIEAWVKWDGSTNIGNIIMKGDYGWGIGIRSDGMVEWWQQYTQNQGPNSTGVAVPVGVWTHIAVVVNHNSSIAFYINGQATGVQGHVYGNLPSIANNIDPLILGRQGSGCACNYFGGVLDEVRIWNVARSASEIADNRYCSVSPSASLAAYYRFDQGVAGGNNSSVTTVADASGNGHTATWNNFTKTGTTSNLVAGVTAGVASVSIVSDDRDNALCSSTTATFTATGFAAISGTTYQWYRGTAGTTAEGIASASNTLTLTDLADGEKISCVMTSPVACLSTSTATSNQITISLLATPTCDNGGMATPDCGCACPPGFSGPTCATVVPTTQQGLAFDGSNDHIYVNVPANNPVLNGSEATLEAWVKIPAYGTYSPIIRKGNYWGIGITNTGKLEWTDDNYPNSGTISTGAAVPLNTWNHVAAVVKGTTCTFYLNGELHGTASKSALSDPNSTYIFFGTETPHSLNGSLDEVRVWNVARSQSDIQAAMHTELAGTEAGLIGYYKFNETSGIALPSHIGCGDATLNNFALSGTTSNWTTGALLSAVTTTSRIADIDLSVGEDGSTTNVGKHIAGTPVDFTYTISSIGDGSITLAGSPYIVRTSGSDFSVLTQPATGTITSSSPQTFTIRYTPSATPGVASTASFVLYSNDCNESSYEFTLTGTACALATPVATITTSDGDANVCSGFSETFAVSVQHPGNTVAYQWYKNGNPVSGATSTSFSDGIPAALNDQVYCEVSNTGSCVAANPVSSNTITISTITSNPVCLNGGTVAASCACDCPPGFAGPTCATAVATTAQGLAFSGGYSYVQVSYDKAPYLSGTQATLEAWVKRNNSGAYYTLLKKGYSEWGLGITGVGQLEWMNDYYSGDGILQTSSAITVPQNDWTHVAIVADGSAYTFYIDGQLVETVTGLPFNDYDGYYDLTLGYNPYGGNLEGGLDEVRIWNVARSQAQIQATMNTELAGTETGLKAYYKFNQTTGYTLPDAVGCANGELQNFYSMNGTTSGWAAGATFNSVTTVSTTPELAVYGPDGIEVANDLSAHDLVLGAQEINTTKNYVITLSNIGGGTLDLTQFDFQDYSSSLSYTLISGPTVPSSLAPGQSTTLTIQLTTDGSSGQDYDGYFAVWTNDCNESVSYFLLKARSISGTVDPHRGNMLHLDGSGDFVQCASPSNLDFGVNDAFCGEAWVRTSNTTATSMQILAKRTSSDGWGFSLENGRPTLSFAGYGNLQTYTNGSMPVVTDGKWHHLAFSYESGSTNMFLYVDGLPFSGSPAGLTPASGSSGIDFCIGAADPNSPFGFFDGDIEEVRVWSDARQQADIRDKMHLTLTGSESSLVSYFQFNESTGNVTDGITGNNGSLQGDASRPVSTLSVAAGFTHAQVVNGPGSYTFGPFSISFSAMSSPGSNEGFFVSQLNDFPLNNVAGLPGTALSHWVIRQAGTQTFSYNTITVVLPVGTVISAADAATPSNFKLYKRETNSAGGWTEIGYGISASIPSRTVVFTISPALTSFSEFVAGSSGSTFPVEWLSFEAERTASGHALLNWATASEHNNAGFGVEYSLDGNSFMELGFVPGAGTSELPLSYRYETPVQEAAYFRLKQTDMNGSASYSETRFVAAVANTWYFAPNPVRGTVKLHGVLPADSYVHTTIHSVDGRLLLNHVGLDAEAAVNARIGDLPAGLYLFQLRVDGKKVATQQMMVE